MTLRVHGICRACRQMSALLLLDDHRCPECRATGRQELPLLPLLAILGLWILGIGVGLPLLMALVLFMLSVLL